MAIPVLHDVKITAVDNAAYPYLAACSCAWQGHAHTHAEAQTYARNHAGVQAWYGNLVSLSDLVPVTEVEEKPNVERSEGSAEAAGQGPAPEPEQPTPAEAGSGS